MTLLEALAIQHKYHNHPFSSQQREIGQEILHRANNIIEVEADRVFENQARLLRWEEDNGD